MISCWDNVSRLICRCWATQHVATSGCLSRRSCSHTSVYIRELRVWEWRLDQRVKKKLTVLRRGQLKRTIDTEWQSSLTSAKAQTMLFSTLCSQRSRCAIIYSVGMTSMRCSIPCQEINFIFNGEKMPLQKKLLNQRRTPLQSSQHTWMDSCSYF